MNAETILEYIENPAKLSSISDEELTSLRVMYPYCQNIQFLFHKKANSVKSNIDQNESYINLYIPPNPLAFTKLKNELSSPTSKNEIRAIDLEIKQIIEEVRAIDKVVSDDTKSLPQVSDAEETIDLEEEIVQEIPDKNSMTVTENIENTEEKTKSESKLDKTPFDYIESELNYIEVNSPLTTENKRKHKPKKKLKKKKKIQNKTPKATKETKDDALSYKTVKKKKTSKIKTSKIKDDSKSKVHNIEKENSFLDWLDSLEEVSTMLAKRKEKKSKKSPKENKKKAIGKTKKSKNKKKNKKTKKKQKLQKKIDASVSLQDGVISITLAELMVKQGHKKEAIKIYKQLKLNNPEKSSYFAAQIKKLK